MNTEPRRPPSEVSRPRTSTERLMEPNEASVAEPLRLPSEATCSSAELLRRLKEASAEPCTSAELPRRPKEASAEPSLLPNKASAAEPLMPRRPKEVSAEPSPPPNKAGAAEPLRHEASTERPRLPWGIEPSAE